LAAIRYRSSPSVATVAKALLMVFVIGVLVVPLGACQVDPHGAARGEPTAQAGSAGQGPSEGESEEPARLDPRGDDCGELPGSVAIAAHRSNTATQLALHQASPGLPARVDLLRPSVPTPGIEQLQRSTGPAGIQLLTFICVTRT
jgi:hypothetical protein